MDLTDELARLQRRMEELQAETERLTQELERLGRELDDGAADPQENEDPRSLTKDVPDSEA